MSAVDPARLAAAVAHFEAGRLAEAERSVADLLAAAPDDPRLRYLEGHVHRAAGRMAEAEASLRRAVAGDRRMADAHHALGALLRDQGRAEEAVTAYRAGFAVGGGAAAWTGLASVAYMADDMAGAARASRRAVLLDPGRAEGWAGLAQCAYRTGEGASALRLAGRAVVLAPEDAEIRFNRAGYRLAAGDLAGGWAEYGWRLARRDALLVRNRPPEWRGEPGRRLLIGAEQGLGDELLFSSCYGDAAALASACTIECDPRLVPLLARSVPAASFRRAVRRREGGRTVVDYGPAAAETGAEALALAGDLPRLLRADHSRFPRRPWLVADPERLRLWRGRLALMGEAPKVGICWRSMLRSAHRRTHYADLADWRPLLTLPGIALVNLQYDDCADELVWIERELGVTVAHWPDLDLKDDLDGTAALIAGLDAVVTAETAVNALAGGLGAPTLCVAAFPNWINLGEGDRSPWFPAARYVFRDREGDWPAVLRRAAGLLAERLSGAGG